MTALKRSSFFKRFGFLLLAGMIGLGGLEIAEQLSVPKVPDIDIVPSAEAVVGRPLTPVSVAGVARRTSRRTVRRNM